LGRALRSTRRHPRAAVATPTPENTTIERNDLSGVLDQDLCIACGACVHVDETLDLRVHPEKLIWEPTHASNERAAAVCPSVGVDYADLQEFRFPGAAPGPFGVVEQVMLAQSKDHDRNTKAFSGGMIKELLLALLDEDDVDGAIVLGHVEGLAYEPKIIRDGVEVDGLP
jgi:coenzyme F420-reducing hydrogenase beta subunit